MNVLKARARKINPDGSLGEWVVGYPCQGIESLYIYETSKYFDLPVVVDPATLNYETGKPDCHGEMIYGGMKVKAWGYVSIVAQDEDGVWRLTRLSPGGIKRHCEYLLQCESSDLEIVKEGE